MSLGNSRQSMYLRMAFASVSAAPGALLRSARSVYFTTVAARRKYAIARMPRDERVSHLYATSMGKSARHTRRDVTGVLEAIGSGGADPGSFARLGVAELPRLVSSELTTLSACDLATGRRRVIGNPGQRLSEDDIAAFDRHFFEHPLVRFHSTHPGGGA